MRPGRRVRQSRRRVLLLPVQPMVQTRTLLREPPEEGSESPSVSPEEEVLEQEAEEEAREVGDGEGEEMTDALKRIEAQHWHHCSECRYDGDGNLTQPCDAVKLARALDYYREHNDGGLTALDTLEEVAGGEGLDLPL